MAASLTDDDFAVLLAALDPWIERIEMVPEFRRLLAQVNVVRKRLIAMRAELETERPMEELEVREHPIIWFSELLVCAEFGHEDRLSEAQAELWRLGWVVGRQFAGGRECPATK